MNTWLSTRAIVAVCRTFVSDRIASAILIRRMLTPEALAHRGYEELPRLAHEIKHIIPYDASLVAEIYRAAFGYVETSKESTSLGGGRILSLTSSRAQDYELALFSLAEAYRLFLELHPVEATLALISIAEIDKSIVRYRDHSATQSTPFTFHGMQAQLVGDHSYVWDQGSLYNQADGIRILDAWCENLPTLAASGTERFSQILELIGERNSAATIWRRLLVAGAQYPETIGIAIRELLWAPPILVGMDTYQSAGQCISAVFALLPPDERTQIERAILGLVVQGDEEDEHSRATWHERRLLGCLPEAEIVLGETREALGQLKETDQVVANDLPFTIEDVSEDELRTFLGTGVHIDIHDNPLGEALDRFCAIASASSSSPPTSRDLAEIIPAAKVLEESIAGAVGQLVSDQQRSDAWYAIAHACAWLARSGRAEMGDEAYVDLARLLLNALSQGETMAGASEEADFADLPSWNNCPRVSAAEGLMLLARFGKVAEIPIQESILCFAADPRPAVRYQVANRIGLLNALDSPLTWQLIEERGSAEPNVHVAARVVQSFYELRGTDPDRAARVAKLIYDRFAADGHNDALRNSCANVWASLVIQGDHVPSRDIFNSFVEDVSRHSTEVSHAAECMRNVLNSGPIDPPDPAADGRRKRATALLLQFTKATHAAISASISTDPSSRSTADQERITGLLKTADVIGNQVYFASGAFDEKQGKAPALDPRRKARFYGELGEVIAELGEIGLARVAYHFVEMFGSYVEVDPRSIFLQLERMITVAAQRDGLAFEGLAVDAMIKVVSRYLADYRGLLRTDDACRAALISILDTFVVAGWPQAWQLTYKLGDIDR